VRRGESAGIEWGETEGTGRDGREQEGTWREGVESLFSPQQHRGREKGASREWERAVTTVRKM